jgi:hypothetical protein
VATYISLVRPRQLTWGATGEEVSRPLPGDDLVRRPTFNATRAISIGAPPETVWPWLVQVGTTRAGWYSYDLLDNFGRRSPRVLTPGLERLESGQRFMSIFRLVSFARDEHITLRSGRTAVTYAVSPQGDGTRLAVRIRCAAPRALTIPLLLGDLVMIRRQLLNLRQLAERVR